MCSGKVYYDLYEEREKRGVDDVYLLRVEQLYPVPSQGAGAGTRPLPQAEIVWCQEEPRNMGAWDFIEPYLEWVLNQLAPSTSSRVYAGGRRRRDRDRPDAQHLAQLKAFLDDALGENVIPSMEASNPASSRRMRFAPRGHDARKHHD